MTPKEKAQELVDKFVSITLWNGYVTSAKQCALIAVDEILNHHSQEQNLYRIDTYYWKEVKQEIESSIIKEKQSLSNYYKSKRFHKKYF